MAPVGGCVLDDVGGAVGGCGGPAAEVVGQHCKPPWVFLDADEERSHPT